MAHDVEITAITLHRVDPPDALLKARVSVVFNGLLAVHALKVIQGSRGLFVSMPARRTLSGGFSDIVHTTNQDLRARLESAVLAVYRGGDWRGEATGVPAPIGPPPDCLVGRQALAAPGGSPSDAVTGASRSARR